MQQYNDEIQLKDILNKLLEYKTYLIKKKVRILIASFFFFVLGVFIAFYSETKYNAELTFIVEEEGNSFGVMSAIDEKKQKVEALNVFKRMYTPVMGSGVVADYLSNTGTNALASSEILGTVPGKYTSTVEYADDSISKSLRDVARVHTAGIGTRVFYTQHGGYDTHATQLAVHPKLLQELTRAIVDFFEDLRNHNASEEVIMLVFSEFGRRIKDNGSGTDHGSGGGAFLIGDRVEGGLYGQYPSLEFSDLANGEDMGFNIDFRGVYSTLLDQWLGLDASPIVNGTYEQISPFKKDY